LSSYVSEVVSQLRNQLRLPAAPLSDPAGEIEQRVQSLLWMPCGSAQPPVRVAALFGMGGSGKTTVATAYFNRAGSGFARGVFLRVGEEALTASVMLDRQRELLQQLARGLGAIAAGALLPDAEIPAAVLRSQRQGGSLLLVLDDLWRAPRAESSQLSQLLGDPATLPPGSYVLLTSRKASVLSELGWCQPRQLELLQEEAARALLCLHATGCDVVAPGLRGTRSLRTALAVAGGLPVALKVLGGMLRDEEANDQAWQVRILWMQHVPSHRSATVICTCLSSNFDICHMQAAIEQFGLQPFTGAESLTAIMHTSYQHATPWQQAMFLDAALLFRGDLAAYLVGFWSGLIQLDSTDSAISSYRRAERELARLVDLSLVSCNDDDRRAAQHHEADVPALRLINA